MRFARRLACIALTVLAASATVGAASALASPTAGITGPRTAAPGDSLRFAVRIHGVKSIRAFEARVMVDGRALELVGATTRAGAGVGTLGPDPTAHGLFLGFYRANVGSDQVVARFSYRALRAGRASVAVQSIVVVDGRGRRITIAGVSRSIVIGGLSPVYRAPSAKAAAASAPRSVSADLTTDGRLDHADVMEAVFAWTTARERGRTCGLHRAYGDVNGDGCIDVADVQAVAMRAAAEHQLPRVAAQASLPLTLVVDTTADTADATPGDGICRTAAGACSLRAAIDEANRHRGPDTITFNIPGPAPHVIRITTEFQHITDTTGGLTIDGYTEPGSSPNTDPLISNAQIGIVLQGPGPNRAGTGIAKINGIYATSSGNTIRGIAVINFWRDVWFAGTGATGNSLVGSFVGLGPTAATWVPAPLNIYTNGGVMIDDASNNVVGTPALADRNVISGTYGSGVYFTHPGSSYNVVQNNIIGLSPNADRAVRNHSHGVDLNFGSKYNLIGGSGPFERNVISGNKETGIELSHAFSPYLAPGADTSDQWSIRNNQVVGNYIGFMPDGSVSAYSKNVGDGRAEGGIHLEDWIVNNVIAENWITHDVGAAINLQHFDSGNVIRGNHIGVSPNGGGSVPQPAWGVSIRQHSRSNTIVGNEIGSGAGGVWIQNGDNVSNTISRNSMWGITGPGIDLNFDGISPNDPGDKDTGANHTQNFPEGIVASTTAVTGRACGNCTVEVFTSAAPAGANGPGRTYLGSVLVPASGLWTLGVSVAAGSVVTATATAPNGDTSEFAVNVTVPAPPGPGSTVVSDAFTRVLTGGWGSAPTGGPYGLLGAAANYAVDGARGTMTLTAGGTREAWLPALGAADIDTSARFQTDKAAAGGNIFAYLTARRSSTGDGYRAKVRIAPGGAVYVQPTRVVGGAETAVAPETLVPGLTHAPGAAIWVRAQVAGTSPTQISVRVWADGVPEPSAWAVSVTDATAGLQSAGAAGLRAYLGAAATNAPVLVSWDDWTVTLM